MFWIVASSSGEQKRKEAALVLSNRHGRLAQSAKTAPPRRVMALWPALGKTGLAGSEPG